MQRLFLKLLYVAAAVRYPQFRGDLRYFVRDNWYARLFQFRFIARDYLQKKPYKVVEFGGEFDQELRYALPFAYWHYQNGTLLKTISCANTRPFYFFSENHEERYQERVWQRAYGTYTIPNMTHSPSFDYSKWTPVPFKKHYRNALFVYDKPLLVIANKYNVEWDKPPVNFLSIDALDRLINRLKKTYQIVYNRPLTGQIVHDNSEIMDLGEHDWLRTTHPDVLLMSDLFAQHRQQLSSFNQLQLMVYANCERFISMHGGTAALASYFGGINLILSHPGGGWEHAFNEYATIFPAFSGARILHARNTEEVFTLTEAHF